jgi:hypothetical protein
VAQKTVRWHFWRGSLELLTQTARTAQLAVGEGKADSATCDIEVLVEGDRESFASPREFRENVTPEALARFTDIAIRARAKSSDLRAEVRYHWNRPWWKPGLGPDAQVDIHVSGTDAKAVRKAFERLKIAVRRGSTESGKRSSILAYTVSTIMALLCAGGIGLGVYLLGFRDEVVLWTWGIAVFALLLLSVTCTAWLYLALEIAPPGKTNTARTAKFLFPLLIGLGIAGLTKKLYG